jgi:hypothetical protein
MAVVAPDILLLPRAPSRRPATAVMVTLSMATSLRVRSCFVSRSPRRLSKPSKRSSVVIGSISSMVSSTAPDVSPDGQLTTGSTTGTGSRCPADVSNRNGSRPGRGGLGLLIAALYRVGRSGSISVLLQSVSVAHVLVPDMVGTWSTESLLHCRWFWSRVGQQICLNMIP